MSKKNKDKRQVTLVNKNGHNGAVPPSKPNTKFLSQGDLMEYLLQLAVVSNINNNLKMVQAAYQTTVNNIKTKYEIKSSKFEIDRQSGEIKEVDA